MPLKPQAPREDLTVAQAARLAAAGGLLFLVLAAIGRTDGTAQTLAGAPPQTLRETGLYSDAETLVLDPKHVAFVPQYPLWTDGAKKRRWMSLPPGTAIDGSDPDAWIFPVGTRFWKEFAFGDRRIETRFLERQADGRWLYAAYAWSEDQREAKLVSARGRRNAYPLGNGRSHTIPGVYDCKACHEGGRSEVLGFSALQLSPDRDPGALHAETSSSPRVDLDDLVRNGLLAGLPASLLDAPPRIDGATPVERAALGYLHGNCGHCHNGEGPLKNIGLYLRHVAGAEGLPAIETIVGHPVRKPAPGQTSDALLRVEPGRPDRSALLQRISSRYAALQMPPLGTEVVDGEAVALMRRWISDLETFHSATPSRGDDR
jgi:hypothetical protein